LPQPKTGAAGADAESVIVADLEGNSITVTIPTEAPSGGGGAPDPTVAPTTAPTVAPTTAPTQAPTFAPTEAPTIAPTTAPTPAPTEAPVISTVDGTTVKTGTTTQTVTTTDSTGQTVTTTVQVEQVVVSPVTTTRVEDTATPSAQTADIPLFLGEGTRTEWATTASLPIGVGVTTEGARAPVGARDPLADLVQLIDETAPATDNTKTDMLGGGSDFMQALANQNQDTLGHL
jgi:hypothetical protein